MSEDRTVHAETGYAEVVRYDRAGRWYVEDKQPGALNWRTPMSKLRDVVEWIDGQPEGEVTVHWGRPGGLQFDARVRGSASPAIANPSGARWGAS